MKTTKIINQSEVARVLGVHRSYVNKILNGKVKNAKLEKKIREVISNINYKDIRAA